MGGRGMKCHKYPELQIPGPVSQISFSKSRILFSQYQKNRGKRERERERERERGGGGGGGREV